MDYSSNALKVYERLYFAEGETKPEDVHERVSRFISNNEDEYRSFKYLLDNKIFRPNTPTLIAAGVNGNNEWDKNLSGCFVIGMEDSMESIIDVWSTCSKIYAGGAGCGIPITNLREEGSPIGKNKGVASGPLKYLHVIESVANTVKSGGRHRRASNLASAKYNHPDIFKIIEAKVNEENLKSFNISILVDDFFMKNVSKGTPFDVDLISPNGNVKIKTVNGMDIWNKIIETAYKSGDPGLLFYDTANRVHPFPDEKVTSSNPCFGEDTYISTKNGLFKIKTLVGEKVEVYDGNNWVEINNFRITGRDQELLRICLRDGSNIDVTPYHVFYLEDDTKIEAKNLKIGDKLKYDDELIINGNINAKGAYLKGFLVADGIRGNDKQFKLNIFKPKFCCMERLFASALELPIISNNTNSISELGYAKLSNENIYKLNGLTVRNEDNELYLWCSDYKCGIPEHVFAWDLKSKCEFIAGVMDGDGTCLDSKNGFGYQLSSIRKKFLVDFLRLLKSIGVCGKITLNKKECFKMFPSNDGNGTLKKYKCKDCFRLNISQKYSIKLSKIIKFERLKSFADRNITYNIKSNLFTIDNIEKLDGLHTVYCCTVPTNNSLKIGEGIVSSQCGEVVLPPWSICNLGSINLRKCINRTTSLTFFDYSVLNIYVKAATRFLDNVIDKTGFVHEKFKGRALSERPIGLGLMAFSDILFELKIPYNSKEARESFGNICREITTTAFDTSIEIAKEKGPIVIKDQEHFKSLLYQYTNDNEIVDNFKEYGIRNSTVTSIAPTGCQVADTLIISDNGIFELQEIGDINGDKWQNISLNVEQENINTPATKFYINGMSKTKKIILDSGIELESTLNHKYRVLNNGQYLWKKCEDLIVGDKIISTMGTYNNRKDLIFLDTPKNHWNERDITLPEKTNIKLAKFLGMFFANGSVHKNGIRLNLNSKNPSLINFYSELGKDIFNITPFIGNNGNKNCTSIEFNSKRLIRWLKVNDLLKTKSKMLFLTKGIRSFNVDCLFSFIDGYWDGDGSHTGNSYYIDSSSKKISQQLGIIIRALGTDVKISKNISGFGSEMYRVRLINKRRKTVLKDDLQQLNELGLSNCIPDTIVEIQDSENSTYDIEVPINNCYISNSVVSHNSISLSCDCSYSFEPCFALVWTKELAESHELMYFINPIFEEWLDKQSNLDKNKVLNDIVKNNGSIQNLEYIPQDVKDIFVTAHDIDYESKLLMQKEGQKYITLGISSTCNLPNSATINDIGNAYIKAWKYGLKGITVYRDGCKSWQPVNFGGIKEVKKENEKYERPIVRSGKTIEIKSPDGGLYVTINKDDSTNKIIEVFLRMGKQGNKINLLIDALSRCISKGLQSGMELKEFATTLRGNKDDSPFYFRLDESQEKPYQAESIVDAIGIILDSFGEDNPEIKLQDDRGNLYEMCPSCNQYTLSRSLGCRNGQCIDPKCGYSSCS